MPTAIDLNKATVTVTLTVAQASTIRQILEETPLPLKVSAPIVQAMDEQIQPQLQALAQAPAPESNPDTPV